MVGCVFSQLKPSGFYILSCEEGRGRECKTPRALSYTGRGPRVVVSTAAFDASVRGMFLGLGGLRKTKVFLPHPLVKPNLWGA